MTFLTRSEVIGRIINVTYELSVFLRRNRRNIEHDDLLGYADENYEMAGNPDAMTEMFLKLNDEALLTMYKMCGVASDKYVLPGRGVMAGYATAELAHNHRIYPDYITEGFNRVNTELMDSLNRAQLELTRVSNIFETIVTGVNNTNLRKIPDQIEDGLRAAADSCKYLSWLPSQIFTNDAGREKVNVFLKDVEAVFENINSSARENGYNNLVYHVFQDNTHARNIINSARDLSNYVETIRDDIAENGIDLTENITEDNSWIRGLWDNIAKFFMDRKDDLSNFAAWLRKKGFYAEIISDSPTVGWSDENATVEATVTIPSGIASITFERAAFDDKILRLFFRYNLLGEDRWGGVGISGILGTECRPVRFNVDGTFRFQHEVLEITYNLGAMLPLGDFSTLEIRGEVTPSNDNPRASVGVTYSGTEGRSVGLGANVSFNRSDISMCFRAELILDDKSLTGNYIIPLSGSGGSSLEIGLKFRK